MVKPIWYKGTVMCSPDAELYENSILASANMGFDTIQRLALNSYKKLLKYKGRYIWRNGFLI